MKFGAITLQNAPWPELVERWHRLDGLAVDTIWVVDHLGHTGLAPGDPWFDAWSCLTALACETTTARIGPLVSPMTYRNPAVLARTAHTVAEISGGRLELGIGSGGSTFDHDLSQVPMWAPKVRAAAFVSWTERLLEMLSLDVFSPRHEIPLTFGGRSPTVLRLAARFGARWNTHGGVGVDPDEAIRVARGDVGRLDELCAETGRTVIRSVMLGYHGFIRETPWRSDDAFAEVVERWRDAGFDEILFHYPPEINLPEGTVAPGLFERAMVAAASSRPGGRPCR